jgi:hypothetical protein
LFIVVLSCHNLRRREKIGALLNPGMKSFEPPTLREASYTLALSQKEREQEFWLPSPWGEGLGMRANHPAIQQNQNWLGWILAFQK